MLHKMGVTDHGLQLLNENPDATIALITLLEADPEKITGELARLMAELKSILPLFTERLTGWKVDEDLGSPLPDNWDPRLFLKGLTIGCVHPDGQDNMKGENLVAKARNRLAGRGGFSQHELDKFYQNWDDERIPQWFRDAIDGGEICLATTDTVLLRPVGFRYALYLFCHDGQLDWHRKWLEDEDWSRSFQFLIPDNSSN